MDKSVRVAKEIMEACGFRDIEGIHATKFFRRINEREIKSFEQVYFPYKESALKNNFYSILN